MTTTTTTHHTSTGTSTNTTRSTSQRKQTRMRPFFIHDRALEILEHLYDLRYLTKEHLYQLVYQKRNLSLSATGKTLGALKRNDYVAFHDNPLGFAKGKGQCLYYLTKKGYNALADAYPEETLEGRYVYMNKPKRPAFFDHRILNLDILVHLMRETEENDRYAINALYPEWFYNQAVVLKTYDFNTKKNVVIQPDTVVILNIGGTEVLVFCEADTGSLEIKGKRSKRMLKRIERYQKILKDRAFRRVSRLEQFRDARVLIVTSSNARVRHMTDNITLDDDSLGDSFLFTTIESVKEHGVIRGVYQKIGGKGQLFRMNGKSITDS